ncbi:hypothetical protein RB195_005218 [Necator americanus]|uniref:Uncharacterized protein n=1 Tax=Necator americanus TaxID=51031 RepID=A0ABR1BNC1_NECAM
MIDPTIPQSNNNASRVDITPEQGDICIHCFGKPTMMHQPMFPSGPIQSDYVMNQYNDQENSKEKGMSLDTSSKSPLNPPSSIPSQYMDMDLRSFVVVNQNRNYQDFPSTIRRTPLVGHPISASELKRRVESLDPAVYSPMIVNGTLYFISLDNDTRTARSSESLADDNSTRPAAASSNIDIADDVTFTMNELKDLLPQYAIKKLTRYYKEERKQKPCAPPGDDIAKLREAFTMISNLTSHLPSHPAFETVDLANAHEPDIIYLRNALNLLPNQVPPLITDTSSTTTSFTDTNTTGRSVTGNPISSPIASVTGLSTPFTAATDEFARFNAETSVDLGPYDNPTMRDHPPFKGTAANTESIPTTRNHPIPDGSIRKNQVLDNSTTPVVGEDMTKPELLTEEDLLDETGARDYDAGHTPVRSWSTETAINVDKETIAEILRSNTSRHTGSPFPKNRMEMRSDSPEKDVYTAYSIDGKYL